MEEIPDFIFDMIFDYLDNDSLWNVMRAWDNWAYIIGNSSKLLKKFCLILSPLNLSAFNDIQHLYIPFKNVRIDGSPSMIIQSIRDIRDFKDSIQNLTLSNADFSSTNEIAEFFSEFSHLKALKLEKCFERTNLNITIPTIPSLTSLSFFECKESVFEMFKNQFGIEKLTISDHEWKSHFSLKFNELAKILPNLYHIIMEGVGTAGFFELDDFPYKIRKLDAYLMTFWWEIRNPRIGFLSSQKEHLRELKITKLPYDFDGGEILKFIFEQMKLEKFYYGDIPLILNGNKQEVKEFLAFEVQISSTFEMFRQFPRIKKLNLFLTKTGLDSEDIENLLNPPNNLFNNLENLDVLDHSGRHNNFYLFRGLYKNCRNINQLAFRTNSSQLNAVLSECLPVMTEIKEIVLTATAPEAEKRFEIIKNLVPNLKKLIVHHKYADKAKAIFGNNGIDVISESQNVPI